MIKKKAKRSTGNTNELRTNKNKTSKLVDGAVNGATTPSMAKKKTVTPLNKAVRMTVKESQAQKKEESWRRK